jgi:cell division septal protein FtsQ
MNGVSASVLFVVLALLLVALAMWLVRQPAFTIRSVRVEGEVMRNSVATLRANALPQPARQLLHAEPGARPRRPSRRCPGCASAIVQRVWPNRLKVKLEEHRAAAYWEGCGDRSDGRRPAGQQQGEVFQANLGDVEDETLPTLQGPEGSSAAGMLAMWRAWCRRSSARKAHRHAWTCRAAAPGAPTFDSGAEVELGRGSDDEVVARSERFVATVTQVIERYQRPLVSADLRHNEGYALRLRGVTTTVSPPGKTGNRKTLREHGQGIQGSGRRPGHRHRQGDGGGGRGAARWGAAHGRPGRRAGARPETRRGGQHRRHRAVDPAGLKEAEMMADCKITRVYTGITGSHIRGQNSTGMVIVRDKEVTPVDVTRVVETAKAINIPNDQRLLLVEPQEFVIDGHEVKEPIGMSGGRLEVKVHIVTGAQSAAENIVKCVRRCGLEVDQLVLNPSASSHAALTDDEKDLGVALVDIGAGTTDVAIFTDGAIRHTAVIPIAGDLITSDIAMALRTPTKDAEEIKVEYGVAKQLLADPSDQLEVPGLGDRAPRMLSRQALAGVIEPRVEEIFRWCTR